MIRIRAFSLVELVLVVVILGILAAIAAPVAGGQRRGVVGTQDRPRSNAKCARSLCRGSQRELPGALSALDRYTRLGGAMSSNPSAFYEYGPYLRATPPCPVGPRKGATGWAAANANPPTVISSTPTVGWLYHSASGGVWVNDINHFDK